MTEKRCKECRHFQDHHFTWYDALGYCTVNGEPGVITGERDTCDQWQAEEFCKRPKDHDYGEQAFPARCRKCGMIAQLSGFTSGKTLPPQENQSNTVQVYESPWPRRKNEA